MVLKTFHCEECGKDYDVEMRMDETKAVCPVHGTEMSRVYNVTVCRPGADSTGFYGNGYSSPREMK